MKRHCHVWETENLVRPGWEAITIHYGNFHHPTSFQAQLADFAQELPLKTWFVTASDFAGHGKWPMRNRYKSSTDWSFSMAVLNYQGELLEDLSDPAEDTLQKMWLNRRAGQLLLERIPSKWLSDWLDVT